MGKTATILFVCTGNASRSAFAEVVLRMMLEDRGIRDVQVASAGTQNLHGEPRNPQMVAAAAQQGYEMGGVTRWIGEIDFSDIQNPLVVIMSRDHRDKVTRFLPYALWNMIALFNELCFQERTDVPDPHFQTDEVFRACAQRIAKGCEVIANRIENNTLIL